MKKVLVVMVLFSFFILVTGDKILADEFFTEGFITEIKGKIILIDETEIKVERETGIYGEDGDRISLGNLEVDDLVMVDGEEEFLAKMIIVVPISELRKKQALGLELSPEEKEDLLKEEMIWPPKKLVEMMMEIMPK